MQSFLFSVCLLVGHRWCVWSSAVVRGTTRKKKSNINIITWKRRRYNYLMAIQHRNTQISSPKKFVHSFVGRQSLTLHTNNQTNKYSRTTAYRIKRKNTQIGRNQIIQIIIIIIRFVFELLDKVVLQWNSKKKKSSSWRSHMLCPALSGTMTIHCDGGRAKANIHSLIWFYFVWFESIFVEKTEVWFEYSKTRLFECIENCWLLVAIVGR